MGGCRVAIVQQVCHFCLLQHSEAVRALDGMWHVIPHEAPERPLIHRAPSMLLQALLSQARMRMLSRWAGHMMESLDSLGPLQR